MKARHRAASVLLAASLVACTPLPHPVFDADADASADGLRPVRHSGFRRGWIRPDGWAPRYDEILGQFVGIAYRSPPRFAADSRPGRDGYALPDGMEGLLLEALAESFTGEFGQAGGLGLARAAGPGVMRARVVLFDLVLHAPLARIPAADLVWIASAGELSVLIELRDSTSDECLARFLERDSLAREGSGWLRATPGPVGYEARRIFRRWARDLRLVIDALRAPDASGS